MGARFLTTGKGESQNKACGVGLELEVSKQTLVLIYIY